MLDPDASDFLGVSLVRPNPVFRLQILVIDENPASLGTDGNRVLADSDSRDCVVCSFEIPDLKERLFREERQRLLLVCDVLRERLRYRVSCATLFLTLG